MAGYQDCLDAIRKVDDTLTDDEISDLVEELQRRQKVLLATGEANSIHDAAMKAADQIGKEQELAASLVQRQQAENLIKRNDAKRNIEENWGDDVATGVRAWLMGSNKKGVGARDSVKAAQVGLHNKYLAGFEADLIRADMKDAWLNPDKDFHFEVAQVVRAAAGGEPAPAVSIEAQKLGAIIQKWQETARINSNKAGSYIGKLPDYMFTQSHDPLRIRMSGGEGGAEWKQFMLRGLDWGRMGFDPTDVAGSMKFLDKEYNRILSGNFEKEGAGVPMGVPSNLAKRVSAERVFHFTDAKSAFDYNELFGKSDFRNAVMNGLRRASQNTGLMQKMGTNPESMLDWLVADQKKRLEAEGKTDAVRALSEQMPTYKDMLKNLDGSINAVGNHQMAALGATVRAVEGFKLGSMLFSQFGDIPIYGAMARASGRSMVGAMAERLAGVFQGRRDLETRAFASSLGVFFDHFGNLMNAQHSTEAGVNGMLSRGSALFMRLTGGPWWQDSARVTAGLSLGHQGAVMGEAAFDALPVKYRQQLEAYGIDSAKWDVMRQHGMKEGPDGRMYLVPDQMRSLANDAVDPLIQDKVKAIHARTQEVTDRLTAMNQREAGWVANRQAKLEDFAKRAEKMVADIRSRRAEMGDALTDKLLSRYSLIEANLEKAKAETDIAAYLRTQSDLEKYRAALYSVEDGKDADVVLGKVKSVTERYGVNRDTKGVELGKRIARADQKIKDIEKSLSKFDKETERMVSGKEKDLAKRLGDRLAEFKDFALTAEVRAMERQELIDQYQSNVGNAIDRARNKAREDLEDRLFNMYADQISYLALEPDANTRRLINMGTVRGTWRGETARAFWQFKSFTFAYIQKVLGTLLESDTIGQGAGALRRGQGDMAGLAGLIAASTAFGYVSMTMKDLIKGREPRDVSKDPGKVLMAAMAQGGGLGIYGDFLFGEANRYGGGVTQTLMGPAIGDAIAVGQMTNEALKGEGKLADWMRFTFSHVPNLWWTKAAFDYFVAYKTYEALNPGYVARMQQRLRRENGQEMWLRPQ